MQPSSSSESLGHGAGPLPGSLSGRLTFLLATFIVVATVAVVVREYGVGEARLVAETGSTLSVQAAFVADRLEGALAERQRLVALWAALESSQDLAVDDVDKRVSQSLADLVTALGRGTEAVAVRDGVVLSASEPARLGTGRATFPHGVVEALRAPHAGVIISGGPEDGVVVASADVASAVDGRILGRIVVWSGLQRFLASEIPVELTATRLVRSDGEVLVPGPDSSATGDGYLWADHTARTAAGPMMVSVGSARSGITRELRESGRKLATLALVFLVLALPTALLVTRTATASLARLTRAAREMDAHHPEPIPAASPWAPSEVRVLADAMSSMVRRLEEARADLARSESLAAVGVLTKSLAHEIRTPLSVLRAGTEILARAPQAGERSQEVTRMLEAEVERLARLVDDLLVFGRPSTPAPRDADLLEIARSAVDALEAEAAEQQAALTLEGRATPLQADPDQLRQVVVNLITNAVRASEGGGHVVVRIREEAGNAVLEVEDDGVGIPPDRLDEIWKPLVTTHRSGNGLGLPIVRQLVEAHGGRCEVRSHPGEGTRMRVILPIQNVEDA